MFNGYGDQVASLYAGMDLEDVRYQALTVIHPHDAVASSGC